MGFSWSRTTPGWDWFISLLRVTAESDSRPGSGQRATLNPPQLAMALRAIDRWGPHDGPSGHRSALPLAPPQLAMALRAIDRLGASRWPFGPSFGPCQSVLVWILIMGWGKNVKHCILLPYGRVGQT